MSDDRVIESHVPLLDLKQVKKLDGLSNGLNLNQSSDQQFFLARVRKMEPDMGVDHALEYLVNNCDIPVGNVIPAIRLSPNCNPARRIHWGVEQVKRHKECNGQPAAAKVSKELAGSHA